MIPIVPAADRDKVWRKDVERHLNGRTRSQLRQPSIPHPMSVALGLIGWWDIRFIATTGGFVDAWITRIPVVARQAVFVNVPIITTAGSTITWRLKMTTVAGDIFSGEYFHGSSLSRNWRMEWLHGLPLWETENVYVAIQADVTITTPVTDVVDLFIPYGGALAERIPVRATTDGLLPGGL